jgi:hypothetical protein
MTDSRAAISAELATMEEDLFVTEKAHFIASEELKHAHFWIGLLGTISASASAAMIAAKSAPIWPGILSMIAALASGILTFIKPEEKAAKHLAAGRSLAAIRTLARQHREIDLIEESKGGDVLRNYVTEITEAKTTANNAAPSISNRRHRKAKEQLVHHNAEVTGGGAAKHGK